MVTDMLEHTEATCLIDLGSNYQRNKITKYAMSCGLGYFPPFTVSLNKGPLTIRSHNLLLIAIWLPPDHCPSVCGANESVQVTPGLLLRSWKGQMEGSHGIAHSSHHWSKVVHPNVTFLVVAYM